MCKVFYALISKLADLTINPAVIIDMDTGGAMLLNQCQSFTFYKNAQSIITNRLQSETTTDTLIGFVVGIVASAENANGGNGDDLILDASLNAAGTTGVDSAETIWGVATDVAD
jgi:hypothetical protein